MTKEEAKEALEQGKFVRHKTDLYTEYVFLKKLNESRWISDSEGFIVSEKVYWTYYRHPPYSTGWEIVAKK